MQNKGNTREVERILKALANLRRILILKYLRRIGRAAVADIAGEIKLSIKATSKHLVILSAANLLEREQVSTTVYYQLASPLHRIVKSTLDIL